MMIEDGIMYAALLGILGFFFVMQLRMMFFPHMKGEIIEFESIFNKDCNSCRGTRGGKTSYPIKVKTDEGQIISAEISPCTVCIEKIGVGARIGITKVGDRHIAQACANLRKRNA